MAETLKPTGLYKQDSNRKWPCPGGWCSHYKCIVQYESHFVGRSYYLGKNKD